ncbi:transglycosylase domain-containing protein [Paenibacillus gansuensis]|uniref:Transglycosylase domain-containing protein n=1 Tax=Paenibacillus gansuensis TaxID=306542 RepID=A0ABW5PDZ0_9BACL
MASGGKDYSDIRRIQQLRQRQQQAKQASSKEPKHKKRGSRWVKWMLLAAVCVLLGFIGLQIAGASQNIDKLRAVQPSPTYIYDVNGQVAVKLSSSKTEKAALRDVSAYMTKAVVAVEDRRFYEHKGTDWMGVIRAAGKNLTVRAKAEGGSTITQQLAKNVFLSAEKTYARKWKELLLAQKIESAYSKEEILEMYLNQVYYGEGAWGIRKAAAVYFGKLPKELTLSESALLAGLVKAPSRLTPYKHMEDALDRRNLVLSLMKEQGKISEAEYTRAVKEQVVLQKRKDSASEVRKFPYYTDYVIQEAIETYGLSQNEVLYGGLHIYTEMDPRIQQAAEAVYNESGIFPEGTGGQLVQSGSVMIDPATGGIRAMVGGRGKPVFRGFNRAVQLKRQPGSSLKPIAVYAPAIEKGYTGDSILKDEPVDYGGYRPGNADGRYRGNVTLSEALIHSYNVPAVNLLHELGIEAGVESAEAFGIPLSSEDGTLGLALGGLHEGTSPLKMAQAFSVFANRGLKEEAHAIQRIVVAGEDRELKTPRLPKQVIRPETADAVTSILVDAVEEGTGEAAKLQGRQVAGKTGTTQVPGGNGSGAKDNWFVGYTPQLVAAVWLGYDQSSSKLFLNTTGSAAAAVFHELMARALEGQPKLEFAGMKSTSKKDKKQREKTGEDKGEKSHNGKGEHKDKEKSEDKKEDKKENSKKSDKQERNKEKKNDDEDE